MSEIVSQSVDNDLRGYGKIKTDYDSLNQSLAGVAVNIDNFPKQNGETDDSGSFTRALNSLPSNGGKIIIPHGKIYTGTFLINKANIRITGGGTLKGLIQLYGVDTTGISRFDPSATGDIYIEGITIDGEKLRNGITCKWVFGVTITNCTFKHCIKAINFETIGQAQHCSRFTIANNRIWDCNYGLYMDLHASLVGTSIPYGVGDITFSNNVYESRNSGWDGTFGNIYHIWAKGLDGLICNGNVFFFSTTGGELSNVYLDTFNWVHFEGNQFFQPIEYGIKAINGSNLNISNNNFAWTGKQSVWLSNIQSGAVRGNNFTWKDDNSVLVNKTGVYVEASPFFIGNISNNNFYFPNEYAIYIKDSSLITINGNNARNKYATAEPVKIDSLSSCNDIMINGNLFTNFPTSLQTVLGSKPSLQRLYYMGNGEGGSASIVEGMIIQKRVLTVSASQTTLDATNYDQFNFNNATTHSITTLNGGVEGKEVVFVAFNGNTTINNTVANLKGAVNVTLPNKGTMRLKYTAGAWFEMSRNF